MKIKSIIGAVLLLTVWALPGSAQIGEQRHNLAVGFNGGININSVSFSPTVRQKNLMGINGGLTMRYISEKYFSMICGAQVELNFSQHGWSEFDEDHPELEYTRTMNYVEIPLLAHLAFGKDRGVQFFIHAGPQIGFFISDTRKKNDAWEISQPRNSMIRMWKINSIMVLREGQDWSYVLKPEISSWKEDIIMPYPTFIRVPRKTISHVRHMAL